VSKKEERSEGLNSFKKLRHRKLGTKRFVIPKDAIILNDLPASAAPMWTDRKGLSQ